VPGAYSEANRPRRPGSYFNFVARPEVRVAPAIGSVVAVPIIHTWGPENSVVQVGSLGEFDAIYGNYLSAGRNAVQMAFRGEDLDGVLGAGAVMVYRMVASGGAKATRILTNTTPATAITLSGRYKGTKGNDLKVTVQDYAADAAKTELILYDGSVEVERYVYADTDINDLGAQINGTGVYAGTGSDWVTAVVAISGTALTIVTSVSLTGGNDGSTLVSGDWTTMSTALEVQRFSLFAPYDLTDSSIVASLKLWAVNMNKNGKHFISVFGGALNEDVATAITRSAALNSIPSGESQSFGDLFVNLGVGSVEDSLMLDASSLPTVLSTSQLAPRLAGILAARGEAMSITMARMRGLKMLAGPTEGDILKGYDGGVVVLARDSDIDAPVHVEKGLTTYISRTNPDKPYKLFSNPKYIRTMHGYETELNDYWARNGIGKLPVNDKTREAVVGRAQQALRAREAAGVIQPGWTVVIASNPSDDDEFVETVTGWAFGRSLEQIFFKTIIR